MILRGNASRERESWFCSSKSNFLQDDRHDSDFQHTQNMSISVDISMAAIKIVLPSGGLPPTDASPTSIIIMLKDSGLRKRAVQGQTAARQEPRQSESSFSLPNLSLIPPVIHPTGETCTTAYSSAIMISILPVLYL